LQPDYPADFTREQGFTEADWLSCLPGAVRGRSWQLIGLGLAEIELDGGRLTLRWQALEPRCIALVRLPRLSMSYHFDAAVSEAARIAFMKYFDLYMQRGGG
jgi:hypothetical protein